MTSPRTPPTTEAKRPSFLRSLLKHVAIGVPLSALLHTVVQTAADTTSFSPGITVLHFVLGTIVGSIVLVPAYSVQTGLARGLSALGVGRLGQVLAGGTLQALFVAAWAVFVGIEPSLPGRFALPPVMIAAGFLAGAVVAALAAPCCADPPSLPRFRAPAPSRGICDARFRAPSRAARWHGACSGASSCAARLPASCWS